MKREQSILFRSNIKQDKCTRAQGDRIASYLTRAGPGRMALHVHGALRRWLIAHRSARFGHCPQLHVKQRVQR